MFALQRKDGGPKLLGYHRGVFGQWQAWQAEAVGLRSRALGGLLLNVVEVEGTALRLYEARGRLLPSDEEARDAAVRREETAARREENMRQRADAEGQRAEEERRHTEDERQRAELARLQAEYPEI